jgi:uncharacterized membrane protein
MNNRLIAKVSLVVIILILILPVNVIFADEPVVHALLFFSPSCPHCQQLIAEDLPPLMEKFGDQIVILGINTYTEKGAELFFATVGQFNIPQEMAGVPMLIIGETVLIGSIDIPQRFPELIATGLESGGIDWPDIPGLTQLLAEESITESNENNPKENEIEQNLDADKQENRSNSVINQDEFEEKDESQRAQSSAITSDIGDSNMSAENMTMVDRFMQDRTGNSISTLLFIGMISSVVFAGVSIFHSNYVPIQWPNWVVAILLFIGLAVAIYMAYVEFTRSEAVCGPVGDCNTVQQSPYASLFGIIPIGLLGVLGYLVIGILWVVSVFGEKKWRKFSLFSLWGLLLGGTLFSIYLTFLEPFVIGATCVWCLTSAVVMTLLFWNSTANIQQIDGLKNFKVIGKN